MAIPFPEIDPVAIGFELFGVEVAIRWYALAYLTGLLFAWWWVARLMRRPALWPPPGPPIRPEQAEALLTWMVVGVILGGRLGMVLFYEPSHYLAHPWEIPQIWRGGMAFHGGFLGVCLGVWLWSRSVGASVVRVGDAVASAAPVGILLGRIANFVNGELWGRTTDLPWGVVFPGAGPAPRHPSQLYEAVLEGAVPFLVMWWLATRRGWLKTPGAMIGVFLTLYGLGRTLVEFVRQPDEIFRGPGNPLGLAVQWSETGGLTQGQLLSLPMLAAGLALILAARRGAFAGARRA